MHLFQTENKSMHIGMAVAQLFKKKCLHTKNYWILCFQQMYFSIIYFKFQYTVVKLNCTEEKEVLHYSLNIIHYYIITIWLASSQKTDIACIMKLKPEGGDEDSLSMAKMQLRRNDWLVVEIAVWLADQD